MPPSRIRSSVDVSSPLTFSLTFPRSKNNSSGGTKQSTEGDVVEACLEVRSNLRVPIHARSITVVTSVGCVDVPGLKDLCEEGGGGKGVCLLPGKDAIFFVPIVLPSQLASMARSGGITTGTTAPRNMKPKTSGLTRAGKIWIWSVVIIVVHH